MTTILENTADVTPGAPVTGPDDTKGLSQGRIVLRRFLGHRAAMVSVVVLAIVVILAVTSIGAGPIPGWWKYTYTENPPLVNGGRPTMSLWPLAFGDHPFGQDRVGGDLFAQTMRGTQISMTIMLIVGALASLVGVLIGACAGYFRGWVEAVLMRFTDMIIIIPALIAAAVVAKGARGIVLLGVFLGLVSWMGMARLVRGDFLSLREREFVDAARLAGASNRRIIFKHILPNAIGVITVNATLLMSAAILTETALSYVQLGVKSPDVSLGKLISDNQAAFSTRPWLFWFPGLFIVLICLTINFIGDGLRDAFDPRQKKISLRKVAEAAPMPGRERGVAATLPTVAASEDEGRARVAATSDGAPSGDASSDGEEPARS